MQGTAYSIQQVVRGGKQTMTSGGPFWGRTPEEKADLAAGREDRLRCQHGERVAGAEPSCCSAWRTGME